MKKFRMLPALLLVIALTAGLMPARAAGKLKIREETLLYYESFDGMTRFKYSAIVENTGKDTATMLESGFYLLAKGNAALFQTDGHLDMYPQALGPGEVGVVSLDGALPEGKGKKSVSGHKLELNSADEAFPVITRYPAIAEYFVENEDDPDMLLAGVIAEVSNNTGSAAFDLSYAAILRDKKGKLVTALAGYMVDIGVPAGGKILLRSYLDHNLEAYLRENSLTPESVEVIAFTQQYDDY